jgi:hypothetical protein
MLIATTERAGTVAVHAASAVEGVLVVSVIAERNVAPTDVLAAAHDVAALLSEQPSSARRISLFDLPIHRGWRRGPRTEEGHAWTLTEIELETGGPERQEAFEAVLPAWTARNDHDLLGAGPGLGFTDALHALAAMCHPDFGPYETAAKQSVVASFTRVGSGAS